MSSNIESLLAARVDAIAFTPVIEDASIIRALSGSDIYKLQLLGNLYPQFDYILFDDYKTTCFITDYLIKRGHRKIMMISPTTERSKGMFDTLHANRIETYPGNFISTLQSPDIEQTIRDALTAYTPTAVITVAQQSKLAFMKVIKSMMIKVPDDVSLISYDDDALSEIVELTSVAHDIEMIGKQASHLILSHILPDYPGYLSSHPRQHILLDTIFKERGSVKRINFAPGEP